MVFRKEAAPMTKTEFMDWYEDQTEWTEEHTYDDPVNTTVALRNWFMEMIQTFPAMNGPFASENDEDNPNVADYCIGRDVIYVAFAWSLAEQAYTTMLKLAEKHGVGFFDASGNDGDLFFHEKGQLRIISNASETTDGKTTKAWWKFW